MLPFLSHVVPGLRVFAKSLFTRQLFFFKSGFRLSFNLTLVSFGTAISSPQSAASSSSLETQVAFGRFLDF